MRGWSTEEQISDAEIRANVANPIAGFFTSAKDVKPEQTSFLWFPYLIDHNVNILGGKAGTGKTWFLCGLMSAVSSNRQPPEMAGTIKRYGPVLYLGGEDGNGVIAERLETLGGRSENIILCEKSFDITGDAFEDIVEQYRPVLIVIDPLMSYMQAETNVNDPVTAKQSMDRLRDFARQYQICVLCVIHPPKKEYPDLLDRFIGSGGYTAGARAVTFIGYHPADANKRVGIQPKNNAIDTNAFVFEIDPDAGFLWAGEDATITAKLITEAERVCSAKGGKLKMYADVLTEVMRINPTGIDMTASEILQQYSKLHEHEINVKSFGQMLNKEMFALEMEKAGYRFIVGARTNNRTKYECYDAEILQQANIT